MLPAMTGMIDQAHNCRVAVLQGWLSTTHYSWVPVTLILLQIFRIEGYVASGLNPSSAVPRSTRFYILWKLDLGRALLSWFLAMAVSNHMYLRLLKSILKPSYFRCFLGPWETTETNVSTYWILSFFSFLVCVCSTEFCIVAWFGSAIQRDLFCVRNNTNAVYDFWYTWTQMREWSFKHSLVKIRNMLWEESCFSCSPAAYVNRHEENLSTNVYELTVI